jgi:hypothetical protein
MAGGDKNDEQKKVRQAEEARKALLDYESEAAALRAKTERLRALRLARDAALPPAPTKTPAKKAKAGQTSRSKSKSKPKPLSEWLDDQAKDGR